MNRTEAATAAPPADEGLDRRRLATVASQAGSLRWQIVATAVVIAALVWPFVPWPVLGTWLALVIGVREVRARQLHKMVGDNSRPVAEQLPRVVAWNAVIGVTNGAAALFMWWLDQAYDAVLTMILVSWAAGAVSTSAPLLRAYTVYSACLFVPTSLMWVTAATPLSLGVAALILMFAGVQYRFAKQNAAVFEESYLIRRENDELVRQLAAARDVAEAANQAKSRFLAAASHDLRQPLHALTLQSGVLAQDPGGHDAPALASEISSSIESLARLLDSLLDISKLDAGVVVVELRPIRLHRLLLHLVRSHEPQARAKGLALRLECPPETVVQTDPLLLERLLRNLLENALKYTDSGEVCLLATTADIGQLRVSVRDSGRGIPDDAQVKVFEEFYQVDNRDGQRNAGLGLGLAIVKRLAGLLELPIELQSRPGHGTVVSLRMPQASGLAEEPAPAPVQAPMLRGVKVLLIDDEVAVRGAMQRVLRRFGCDSMQAASSAEAVEQARGFTPDIVLADCRLGPDDSGIAAVLRLRERWPGLPALLISGDTDAALLREAERHGLRLLHKPLTLPQLQAAMTTALEPGAALATP